MRRSDVEARAVVFKCEVIGIVQRQGIFSSFSPMEVAMVWVLSRIEQLDFHISYLPKRPLI